MEESNHAALPMEGAKYLCKKVSCHRHSKNDFKRLVAKKNLHETWWKNQTMQPWQWKEQTNRSFKWLFLIYVRQMKNVHGFAQIVDYHVSLLLADQLQDKIQENSPLSLDFLWRLSLAWLLTLFGGQLSRLFTSSNKSSSKSVLNSSEHPRLLNMDPHLFCDSSRPSLSSYVETTSRTALNWVVSIFNSLPRTSIESLRLSNRCMKLSRKVLEGELVPSDSKTEIEYVQTVLTTLYWKLFQNWRTKKSVKTEINN